MKKQFLKPGILLLLHMIAFGACVAQSQTTFDKRTKENVKALHETYVVTKSSLMNLKFFTNIKDKYLNVNMNPPKNYIPPEPRDITVNTNEKIAAIFKNIFSPDRLLQLEKDTHDVQIAFNTELNGDIADVDFSVPQTSSLTPFEVEQLEAALKKAITIKLNQQIFKGYTYVMVTRFINLPRLINNQPNAVM